MIKRILYSQSEKVIKDDYFVIDGVLEQDNVSNLSLDAFQLINETENWKEIYKDDDLVIRKKGNYLNIKSHYINKDESGRFMFYVYYVESKNIEEMLNYLKIDSQIINKELGFEAEKLIKKIKESKKVKNIILVSLLVIVVSFLIWETVK
jgi:hypothetical protein